MDMIFRKNYKQVVSTITPESGWLLLLCIKNLFLSASINQCNNNCFKKKFK